jgi:hypothetical protein
LLEVIEKDRLFAIGKMDVTKDMKTRLYAPDFTKEIAVAQTKVKMVFLALCKLRGSYHEMDIPDLTGGQ